MPRSLSPHRRGLLAACAAATIAALAAALMTALPASAANDVKAQYRTSASGASVYQVEPWLKVVNTSTAAVPLSQISLRYYFKADPGATYTFSCDWAVPGCANLRGTFGTFSPATATADRYLEVTFGAGAPTLAPGADSGDIQLRFYRTNWESINQSDDYSFAAQTSYADASRVTAYRNGTRVWGTPPGGTDPTTPPPTDPPTGAVMFDDFSYTSSSDPRIAQRGWTVRSGGGGPGVPDVQWDPSRVTFPSVGGSQVLRLEAYTNGTNAGTRQTEFYHRRKFFEGTYASRVFFTDAPVSGPDGDQMVQTFFTITPLNFNMDPNYGELDFEYLPNGGWGAQGPIMYLTSWETYQPDPWQAVNVNNNYTRSHAGWHDLVLQVTGGRMKYYIDGALVADHGQPYYPETPMSINFNHWFISGGLQGSSTPRAYQEQADWVYFAQGATLTPAQVTARINAYRAAGTAHVDTVPGS